MKKIHLIYNNLIDKVILNPHYEHLEFNDFDSALQFLDSKRKIKIYTNMPGMIEKEKYKNIVDVLKAEK